MNDTTPSPTKPQARSLKWRVALLALTASLTVAFGLGLYLHQRMQQLQRQILEEQAVLLAKALADALDGDLLRRDYAAVEEVAHHVVVHSGIIELAVVDEEGHLLVAVRAEGQRPQVRLSGTIALPAQKSRLEWGEDGRLSLWQAIGETPHSGWLHLELQAELSPELHGVLSDQTLLALLLAAALGVGLQLLLSLPFLAQLARLTEFASRLSAQPGGHLVFESGVREIAQLRDGLNVLSSELARRQVLLDGTRRRLAIRQRVFELLATGGVLADLLALVIEEIEQERPQVLASILLVDAGSQTLRLGAAPRLPQFYNEAVDGLAIADGAGSCGTAAWRGQPVYVADIANHPYWRDWRMLAERAGLAACWSEPILSTCGETLGVLAFYLRQPGEPEEADRQLMRDMAHLASVIIERKRLDEESQLASSVYQSSGEAMFVTDADNRIMAINPAFTRLTGYPADEVLGKDPSILMGSGRNTPALYRAMWQALEATGQWQGEIWSRRRNGEEFAEWLSISSIHDASGRLLRRIGLFSDLTEIKRAEELIWQQTNYDALTGLPNRRLFCDRLKQEIRRAQRLAVLMIDLDHFKTVNDAFGQSFGDKVLIEAAKRIDAQVGEDDTVARLSGDGFAVAMPRALDPSVIEHVAAGIVSAIGQSFVFDGESAFVAASIGITLYPDDAEELEVLLRNAEQAMYVAKQSGRGGFAWFTSEMQLAAQVRRDLVRDLRGALMARQFEIHYQPIVDLANGRIVKAEALLRWHHPERGTISPATFIPMAEELGLIDEIGDWVFACVLAQIAEWDAAGLPAIQVSVNKSPRQFHPKGEMPWLAMLEESGLPGERLVIEITEGLLLGDRPEVIQTLNAYRAAGLEIALDDFGTGYSSLSYLQRFDIDYLKIDRAFVRHLSDNAASRSLTDAMIAMAHKLGLNIVAEGVEDEAQRDFLAAMGCDLAQGYLFARPLPAEEFAARLAKERPFGG